ncbi:hypothetical protein BV25DRAFT_591133 [Artomyces pyxidatus]|uniref:Uncharacterized protein n=1 Tax=Artomyces pyxidatus TaxID=48021 RepID=A0ACB8T3F7_9AGAM|nr:hypothetical protein BV25DRAFT_591133 [Artomyces pyxidatus]
MTSLRSGTSSLSSCRFLPDPYRHPDHLLSSLLHFPLCLHLNSCSRGTRPRTSTSPLRRSIRVPCSPKAQRGTRHLRHTLLIACIQHLWTTVSPCTRFLVLHSRLSDVRRALACARPSMSTFPGHTMVTELRGPLTRCSSLSKRSLLRTLQLSNTRCVLRMRWRRAAALD